MFRSNLFGFSKRSAQLGSLLSPMLGVGLLLALAPACSDGQAPTEPTANDEVSETGTLNLPLVINVGDVTYRLSMSLVLFGTNAYDYIYTDAYSDETQIQRTLPTGDYYAYLNGWQLYKEVDGELLPVSSQLVSSYYSNFSIQNNTTSTLNYSFVTDGVPVTIGQGNLIVNVDVDQVAPVCEPLGDTCGDYAWCPPSELTGLPLACMYLVGSGDVGDSCQSPTDCGANLSCFDFGGGPECGALCLKDAFDQECPTGGTCVAQGREYGVCVPEGGAPPGTSGPSAGFDGGFGGGFGGGADAGAN